MSGDIKLERDYGIYLARIGELGEVLRRAEGLEAEGIFLKTAEFFWQIARDPECTEASRISRLRGLSEQGIPVVKLREMWRLTGASELVFDRAMNEVLSGTSVEKGK